MNINEKNWSKTLLVSYSHLETICGAIDKTILNCGISSCNTYCDTEYIANRMINLMERKKFLINLKVLVDGILAKLKKQHSRILTLKFIDGVDSKLASEVMKVSTRTYFRQINEAINEFSTVLIKMGYTEEALYENYKDENWIMEIFHSFKQKSAKEHELKNLNLIGLALKQFKSKKAIANSLNY